MTTPVPTPPDTMTVVLQSGYGDVDQYRLGQAPVPTPGPGQVLVRVRATTLHADIWHTLHGVPSVLRLMGGGLLRPKDPIPGTDLAGEVAALGDGVDKFRLGERVFGQTLSWNLWRNGGTFAPWAVADVSRLEAIPEGIGFPEAASVATSGQIVLMNMPLEPLAPGARVLVHGAAGCVGSVALQIAKARGAKVVAVDLPGKLDLLRSLGADEVVDGSRVDPTEGVARYRMVFDILGLHPLRDWRRVLEPQGHYVLIGHDEYGAKGRRILGSIPKMLGLAMQAPFGTQKVVLGLPKLDAPPLRLLANWLASGAITPRIDAVLPLQDLPQAMRRLESNQVQGRIVFAP
jgi:NADPH:quinone reductase-like Zn-dependent oxidoreductase